jgi:membrane protein implicated in regulation of membrane protease activity
MESPEVWRWVWLVATVAFAGGEIAVAGSFFLLPFAIGAAVACVLAFLDVGVAWQWLAFVGVSALSLLALFPLRRRLDRGAPQDGIGARRLLGQPATVLEALPGGPAATGLVRVGREEWRAESLDGTSIPAGAVVKVVEVRGTRVVVFPQGELPKEA